MLNRPLPTALRLSERTERMFSGVVGMSLGLLFAAVMAFATPPSSVFHQMFDPRAATSAVPALICCFFFWASLICIARWRRVRALEDLSPTALLTQLVQLVERSGPAAGATAVERSPVTAATPLLRRCGAVLRQWTIRPGLQNADIILGQHVAHDEEALHRGYNLVRTFVWALPVLGLIGTVVGIALAVGGFASFLGGNIDDVRVVKQNLVGVTGGLSFAFLITLLGLLTSLVVMLLSSGLQTREERLYGRIQHDLTDALLPVLQKVAPESRDAEAPAAPTAAWAASLPKIVEAIEAAARTAIDTRERERRDEIVSFTRAVSDASKGVADQAAQIRDNAKALHGVVEATKAALAQQATLQTDMRATAASLTEMSSAVNALQAGTSTLREAVAQVSTALNQFDARTMSMTFSSMRSSLEQLAPILQSFRGPFVFQAVPVEPERRIDGQLRSRG
jgi:biopolymer transport protein ExbB/TolQ